MKTISDLNALIPELIDYILEDARLEYSGEFSNNITAYEEDGWYIEICFRSRGSWIEDRGTYYSPSGYYLEDVDCEITKLTAYHYDEATDEETEFEDSELEGVINTLNANWN